MREITEFFHGKVIYRKQVTTTSQNFAKATKYAHVLLELNKSVKGV